ncbi:MAG: DUF4129 domain-containing protein [Propionibacteriaceae bacterium]|jgi:hypothetical protein|nr:DUF4129 domain-containing protein [Propionibacteriaceae bacterium]
MSPPLTPSADEARQQLSGELSKPVYADVRNWIADQFQRLLDWLTGDPQSTHALSSGQLTAIVVTVAAVAAVAIWTFLGPVRTERRRRETAVLADEDRSAQQLREDAARLAAADEWGRATIELFRALVRSLGERAVIQDTSGLTAHEAAAQAGVRLPDLAAGLAEGAEVFDALAYGRRPGSRQQYHAMLALDAGVAQARPTLPTGEAAEASAVEVVSVP